MDNKKDKRKKILRVSGLIGLFLLVFGLSYALFTVTLNGTKKVKVKTGKLELQLLDKNNNDITDANNAGYVINLDNQVPVDDETGLGTQAFEFKLKNNGSIDARYTVYLDDVALESGETRLPDSAIRYSLTKNGSNDNPQDLTTIGTNPNRKLDEGIIKKDITNTYTLKIWIDEEADNNAMDKVFAATLRVEGTQYVEEPSPYGEKIAETQLSENITATYYQPDGTGYNSKKIKRVSNVEKIDNEERYEGGTLVISGTGEMIGDYCDSSGCTYGDTIKLKMFLSGTSTIEEAENLDYYDENGGYCYKYSPMSLVVDGLTKIGKDSFRNIFGYIPNVTISSTIKVIDEFAFEGNLTETINLSEGLEEIGEDAFSPFIGRSVRIPSTVKKLNALIFEGTYTLEEVYIASDDITIHSGFLGFTYTDGGIKVYCKNQTVANQIVGNNVTAIVDPTKFE